MNPTVIDLFSGCGGFSHGFEKEGFEVIGFVEHWKPAITTFLKNHPNARHLGYDITKVQDKDLEIYKGKVEIIVGGPPCQGFSYCGKRDPKDKRNQLYKEFLRFVRIIEPKIAIIENVPGLLNMEDYDNKKIIDKIIHAFISLGYSVVYKILTASNYGVAQNRKRLIIIATQQDLFPEKQEKKNNLIDAIQNIPQNCNAHEDFKPKEETIVRINRLKQGERIAKNFNCCKQRLFAEKPSKTIVTKPIYIHPYKNKLLTPRELARLQSFPDDFHFCGSKNDIVKQIGNAVPVLMASAIAKKLKEVIK